MNDDELLRMVNENRQLFGMPPQTRAEAEAPCPRCATLETTRRVLKDLLDASEAGDDPGWLCAAQDAASALLAGIPVTGYEKMERERDSLRKLLEEIALRLESGDINYAQGCLLAKRAREACGGEGK